MTRAIRCPDAASRSSCAHGRAVSRAGIASATSHGTAETRRAGLFRSLAAWTISASFSAVRSARSRTPARAARSPAPGRGATPAARTAVPSDQQVDQQVLELGRDARVRVRAFEQLRSTRDEHQLLAPRGKRGALTYGIERRARVAGYEPTVAAPMRSTNCSQSADSTASKLFAGRTLRRSGRRRRAAAPSRRAHPGPPGQQHQQVITVHRLDVHAHGVAERDRAETQPAEPDEIHVRAAPRGAAVRQQRMRLHHARDALARLVEVAGFQNSR